MNITIKVDDITLDTVVADIVTFDEDGDVCETGRSTTVADMVAAQILAHLVKDNRYPALRDRVTEIRDEEIRAAVRPAIDEALTRPINKTNSYGEAIGQPTTLSELIAEAARKQLTEPVDRYDSKKGTLLSKTIAVEVKKAFDAEIADAVKQAREAVAKQIAATASEQITAAAMKVLPKS